MNKKTVKILLVKAEDTVPQEVKPLLKGVPDVVIVGEAGLSSEVLKQIEFTNPEVVVLDMHTPVMKALEYTQKIKKLFPFIKVLVLSTQAQPGYLINMMEAGASGYILKNTSQEELLFAISKIANDGMYLCPEITLNMFDKYKEATGMINNVRKLSVPISDREKDVLELIGEGNTNAEIAQKLFTSVRTIETRRKNLLVKTGTSNTATLIKFAVRNGMLK